MSGGDVSARSTAGASVTGTTGSLDALTAVLTGAVVVSAPGSAVEESVDPEHAASTNTQAMARTGIVGPAGMEEPSHDLGPRCRDIGRGGWLTAVSAAETVVNKCAMFLRGLEQSRRPRVS